MVPLGAFSPDGSLFAVNVTERDIALIDSTAGKEQHRLASSAFIGVIGFAPDGKSYRRS